MTFSKVHAALLTRSRRAPDALPTRCWRYVWRLGNSTLFIKSDSFSLAGASDSQSGANVVLRGAPSILRKRSILSKRQCEHCRSCCVYAVGLSVALYAVPVARATAADLSMLRIPPPRCVEGGLSKIWRRLFLKVCLCMCVCVCVWVNVCVRSLIRTMAPIAVELLERMACHRLFAISVCFCLVLRCILRLF